MNFENLEELLKISEKDFEKEVEKNQIIELNARIEKFEGLLKPDHLERTWPALTGLEIGDRRKKLSAFKAILTKVRDAKEKERHNQNKQAQEEWRDHALKDNLHDLRYVFGMEVDHLMHGTFTMEVVNWQKTESIEFEIMAVSGHKLKIDLRKIISPSTMQMLLAKAFSPIYLLVERAGGYDRKGKPLGYYVSGEWNESHGYEIRLGTTFAVMRV
jgi:hypothetical protein